MVRVVVIAIIENHCGERDMIYLLLLSLRVITPLLSIE